MDIPKHLSWNCEDNQEQPHSLSKSFKFVQNISYVISKASILLTNILRCIQRGIVILQPIVATHTKLKSMLTHILEYFIKIFNFIPWNP